MRETWEDTPFFREFGIKVEHAGEGTARLSLPHEQVRIRGIRDGINGGIIVSFIEAAMRVCLDASLSGGEAVGPTREVSVNYLSAVRGATTYVDARLARQGRRLAVGSVEVRDAESGTLCAIAQVTCAVQLTGTTVVG